MPFNQAKVEVKVKVEVEVKVEVDLLDLDLNLRFIGRCPHRPKPTETDQFYPNMHCLYCGLKNKLVPPWRMMTKEQMPMAQKVNSEWWVVNGTNRSGLATTFHYL